MKQEQKEFFDGSANWNCLILSEAGNCVM